MQCEIFLDNNTEGVYYAGQVISGKVNINLESVVFVKGLALKISGYAKSQWPKSKQKKEKNKNMDGMEKVKYFEGKEDFISSTNYLVGSESAFSVPIPSGLNVFNFSCQIPSNCPSSFESALGHIRYLVNVVFMCPPKEDQIFTMGFTVVSSCDLNLNYPTLSVPTEREAARGFFCRSGQLTLSSSIPQSGYAPGEIIQISSELENIVGVQFKEISYYLNRRVVYTSQQPKEKTKMATVRLAEKSKTLLGNSSRTELEFLQIPQIPPTSYNLSRIIQISYEIEITLLTKRNKSLSVSIPITIGTVGLQRQSLDGAQRSSRIELPIANYSNSLAVISTRSVANNVQPESISMDVSFAAAPYMSAVDLGGGEKHSHTNGSFSPRYPIFNNDLLPIPGNNYNPIW